MMIDVYALTRRFGHLIATHCIICGLFSKCDKEAKPLAYDPSTFHSHSTSELAAAVEHIVQMTILSSTVNRPAVATMPESTTNHTASIAIEPSEAPTGCVNKITAATVDRLTLSQTPPILVTSSSPVIYTMCCPDSVTNT